LPLPASLSRPVRSGQFGSSSLAFFFGRDRTVELAFFSFRRLRLRTRIEGRRYQDVEAAAAGDETNRIVSAAGTNSGSGSGEEENREQKLSTGQR